MVRLQIQLEPAQHRQVKRRAKRLGVSVSEIIRRSVAAHLQSDGDEGADAPARRALAVAGRYVDPRGAARVARNHDAALADVYRR
jgi:Arc/MetJ-type ribon-helix-helix transcriptional regulator